ncbi:hypothetical protein AgCh_022808 [Apium graveolens]
MWEVIDPVDPKLAVKERADKVALAAIYQAIPEDVLLSIVEKKTTKFGQLEEMYVEEAVGTLKAHEERLDGQIEKPVGQLMLNEEEWKKREASEGRLQFSREEWLKRSNKSRGTSSYQGQHDKSKEKENKLKANLAQIQDDEPALLLTEFEKVNNDTLLLNEKGLVPKLQKDEAMKVESNLWYLDNEASNHMTGLRSKFNELDERVTRQVKFGDGSPVEIKGKGSMLFKCKIGEERIFHKVYYIPSLCSNIISLGQLSECGIKVILNGAFMWVYDEKGRLLIKVKRSCNRLYKIILESSEASCLMLSIENTTRLWHSRLGHVNYQAMIYIFEKGMVHGLPSLIQPKEVCARCLMSKQIRKSFPSHANFRAKQPLELIHRDLCGSITPTTKAGNKYFVLLVDDYSRVMWVYLLSRKDEALGAFKKFKLLVERDSEKKVKMMRTDRGGEFCSKKFIEYCDNMGISRQLTTPYTPQ